LKIVILDHDHHEDHRLVVIADHEILSVVRDIRDHFSGGLLCHLQQRIHQNFSNRCKIYLLYFAIDYSCVAADPLLLVVVGIYLRVASRIDNTPSLFLELLLSLVRSYRALLELQKDGLDQEMAQLYLERLSREEMLG
jgi:hypothetical protein